MDATWKPVWVFLALNGYSIHVAAASAAILGVGIVVFALQGSLACVRAGKVAGCGILAALHRYAIQDRRHKVCRYSTAHRCDPYCPGLCHDRACTEGEGSRSGGCLRHCFDQLDRGRQSMARLSTGIRGSEVVLQAPRARGDSARGLE